MAEIRKNTAAVFGVPLAAMGGGFRIELIGNSEAAIDGCRSVAEYSDELIRFNVNGGSVAFAGDGLEIICLSGDQATLRGRMIKVEFCL